MPKLMKPQKQKAPKVKKQKVPKTKVKKQKAVKSKQKRPKKAAPKIKIPKFKAPKMPQIKVKNPLPKNKKSLIIVVAALILVILGAAAAIIFLTLKKNSKTEAPPEAPAYYFSKDEEVSSITDIVGEREFKNLTVIPAETEDGEEKKAEDEEASTEEKKASKKKKKKSKEKAAEEESTEEGKEEKDTEDSGEDQGEENSEEAKDEGSSEEAAPEEEAPTPEEVYQYLQIEDVSADLKSYRTYLEDQKGFFNITSEAKSEDPASSGSDAPNEENEFYIYAGPSVNTGTHLVITLEAAADSYTVKAKKENEPWNTYFRGLWDQQKEQIQKFEKAPKTTTSIQQAEDIVRTQGQEKLGLPEPAEAYNFMAAPGLTKIDGTNYYRVRAYKKQEDDTLVYVGTYLFNHDSGLVSYQLDEATGETTPLAQ